MSALLPWHFSTTQCALLILSSMSPVISQSFIPCGSSLYWLLIHHASLCSIGGTRFTGSRHLWGQKTIGDIRFPGVVLKSSASSDGDWYICPQLTALENLKNVHKNVQERYKVFKPRLLNVHGTERNTVKKNWLSLCVIGGVRFAKHCGKMYSRHLFS